VPGICEGRAELPGAVQRPGDFCASGRVEVFRQWLAGRGVGVLGIVAGAETPGLGAEAADHEVGNAQAWPVEVAMVEQPRPRPGELRQQRALGCSRHPVCAYERRAVRPEPVGGDGDDVGILADVDRTAVHGQRRR